MHCNNLSLMFFFFEKLIIKVLQKYIFNDFLISYDEQIVIIKYPTNLLVSLYVFVFNFQIVLIKRFYHVFSNVPSLAQYEDGLS